jgi:peptide/nickel transport system substrate-binding protein
VTCQVLPPRFPSYQPYCPYTRPPLDGGYHGPDVAKGQALIPPQDKGMRVTVWTQAGTPPISAYLVTVLKQLGFNAAERVLSESIDDFDYIYDPSTRTQLACCIGWGSDFPTPGNFFTAGGGWIGCPASGNYFGYRNSQVDRLIKHAQEAQTTDPVAANRLWAQIDRMVVDDAPMVFDVVNKTFVLTSARVGNYQSNLESGPLWDQMWVQ